MTGAAGERWWRPAGLRTLMGSEIVRFGAVGAFNTAFGLGVFWLLQATLGRVVHYVVVAVVANVVSVFVAYVLQRTFTFRVVGRFWRDLVRFSSVYGVGLLFNVIALPALVELAHLSPNVAQVFVVGAVALGTYVAHRSFTFRHTARASSGDAPARAERAADVPADGVDGDPDGGHAPGPGAAPLLL